MNELEKFVNLLNELAEKSGSKVKSKKSIDTDLKVCKNILKLKSSIKMSLNLIIIKSYNLTRILIADSYLFMNLKILNNSRMRLKSRISCVF